MNESIKILNEGHLGHVSLNAPASLNALSMDMIEQLSEVLTRWQSDDSIKAVLLSGEGSKAFCAGGDVRQLYTAMVAWKQQTADVPAPYCLEFFEREYRLDYMIHRYTKPIVVWGHGITMGGGIGLLGGAGIRVGTRNSLFSMPEITIGLYPDVGSSWMLNRMPKGWGLFLGMTGARINVWTALHCGLITHILEDDTLDDVAQSLMRSASLTQHDITQLLDSLSITDNAAMQEATSHDELMTTLDAAESVEAFIKILEAHQTFSPMVETAYQTLKHGSPTSAHIIFRQLRSSMEMSLGDVFRSEMNLSSQCAVRPDFTEGVRALLIDKDKKPQWTPASLDLISEDWVEGHFQPFWDADNHPLADLV